MSDLNPECTGDSIEKFQNRNSTLLEKFDLLKNLKINIFGRLACITDLIFMQKNITFVYTYVQRKQLFSWSRSVEKQNWTEAVVETLYIWAQADMCRCIE